MGINFLRVLVLTALTAITVNSHADYIQNMPLNLSCDKEVSDLFGPNFKVDQNKLKFKPKCYNNTLTLEIEFDSNGSNVEYNFVTNNCIPKGAAGIIKAAFERQLVSTGSPYWQSSYMNCASSPNICGTAGDRVKCIGKISNKISR